MRSPACHLPAPIWFIHTPLPAPFSHYFLSARSRAVGHVPPMLPRAQLAGGIFTLRPCLIAVKLLDFSLCKSSQIGPKGDLKGLGGRESGKKSKGLHSLPLIAFPRRYLRVASVHSSTLATLGPHDHFVTHLCFLARRHPGQRPVHSAGLRLRVCVALSAAGCPVDGRPFGLFSGAKCARHLSLPN